jgi:trans-aconitate 2-methyltransferase
MTSPRHPAPRWDPVQYARHQDARARPRRDLLARVPDPPAAAPVVADLGCGPGAPTAELSVRWPAARVTGYDTSPEMLEQARAHAGPRAGGGTLDFVHADLAAWEPDGPHEVIFSSAALQWVPGHAALFPRWLDALTPGGTFALQVPGNFGAPSHTLLAALCASPRWRDRLGGILRTDPVLDAAGYFAALAGPGCEVDAWETTYLHVLPGEDAVLEWTLGTALRPVLTRLAGDPEAREAFLGDYRTALRAAYPRGPYGTPFPFRRIFAVAVKR